MKDNDLIPVTIRFQRNALNTFDEYVSKAGISREEFIRILCSIVTTCDIKPSEAGKIYKAYRKE